MASGTGQGTGVRPRRRGVFYGWWLAIIGGGLMALVMGPIFLGLGTFFVALEEQFGWSRTALAGAFSLARAEDTVIGPLAGYLTDRLGTRRVMLIGIAILGAGFLLLSTIQTIVMFYVAFLILTIGAGLATFLPIMGLLNKWFIRKRAMAMGVAQSGVSLGGILVPVLAFSITSVGWRTTSVGLALLSWLLAIPVLTFIRNRPEDRGLLPDGDTPRGTEDVGSALSIDSQTDFTVAQALRTSAFWLIAVAHALSAVVFLTLTIHAIPMMKDKGLSLETAALVVATYTLTAGVFQLVGGVIGDRIPKHLGIAGFMAIQATGMLIAVLAQSTAHLFLFAVVFGAGAGGRTPLLIAIRGDYFGQRAFATIFGLSTIPMGVIMLAGPIGAGYMYDRLGSYQLSFLALVGLNLLGALVALLLRRPVLQPALR